MAPETILANFLAHLPVTNYTLKNVHCISCHQCVLSSEHSQLLCSNSLHLVSLQLQNLPEIQLLPGSLLDQLFVTRASRTTVWEN